MKNLYKQFLIIFTFLISSFGLNAQISGPTTICQNSSANFTCSAAATYNWSVSPSGLETISDPSIQNPDVSFSAAGNYTITVNTASPANTFTLVITVNSLPSISDDNTVIDSSDCNSITGSITGINVTGNSPFMYSWNGGSNVSTSEIYNISPGSYTLTSTDINGCIATSFYHVSYYYSPEAPQTNDVNYCQGETATVLNALGGNGIFTWYSDQSGTIIIPTPTPNTSISGSTTYYVSETNHGCQSILTPVTVIVYPSANISGTVNNTNPITAGQVNLYSGSQGTTIYGLMATTNINANGQYTFTSVPAGDYIIKCIPDSLTYPTLINTYYGDVASWNLADTIHHDCSANSVADINVIEPVLMTGPGVISGAIIEGFGFGQRLINSINEVQVPGGPLSDIDVKLVSLPSYAVVAQTTSDMNGYYEFSNVAVGDYELQIDIPGLQMDSTYFIIITPLMFSANNNQVASSVFSNLDFVADGTAIYIANSIGIKQNENKENLISVYPNPAKNSINIKSQSGDKINGQIEIIDNLGKIVVIQNVNSELTQVNIEGLNSGFYFVKVKFEKEINTFRFIKQN